MVEKVENILHYVFGDKRLLERALTHRSFHEGMAKGDPDNEKLEFLGDSVINLLITEYLFNHFPDQNEGRLSKLKAHLVSSDFLFELATSLKLNQCIYLGKGEEKNNGRYNKKIIASLFEAVVGAIYLDGGYSKAADTIVPFFHESLEKHVKKRIKINDYKSELQEILQAENGSQPNYRIVEKTGTSPRTIFTAAVYLHDEEIGRGTGKNKRQAEQNAAFNALKNHKNLIHYEKLSEVFFLTND